MGDIELARHDNVAVLTVSAPDARNALTPEMANRLVEACDEIDADEALGAAVITGANGTFCSGADRRYWATEPNPLAESRYADTSAIYAGFHRVGRLAVPTIAAVRGVALGAGLNLMLATDLRVVADEARIFAGFLRIGIHPGGGFFTLAGRAGGRETAAAVGIFGEELDGPRAVAAGLAWCSLPDADVEARALSLGTVAAKDPELAREAIRSLRTELGPPALSWDAALHFERATQLWSQRRAGL